jgi:cytochrome c553
MKKIAIATCVLLGLTGIAQASGDPAIGKEKSMICGACHGADGNSTVPNFPKLAGQGEGYLAKQLKEFKDGIRKDQVMSAQAAAVNEADIPHLAAYFASQQQTPDTAASQELATRGQRLFMGGDVANGIPACAACHGPNGAGNPAARFPSLDGQHALYTVTQLQRFKSGERANDPNQMMRTTVARMSEDEMKAVAEYIAGLH